MPKPLIVPLDGFGTAESTLPVVIGLARRTGWPVHLVRVLRVGASESGTAAGADRVGEREVALEYLSEIGKRVEAELNGGAAVPVVLDPPVERALASYVRQTGGVVVMPTSGREPAGVSRIGMVADRVVRWSGMPVILVPPSALAVQPADHWQCDRILVALDGSEAGEDLVRRHVADLASACGSNVTLVEASGTGLAREIRPLWAPLPPAAPAFRFAGMPEGDTMGNRLVAEGFAAELRSTGGPLTAADILALTVEMDTDMIALAVQARADTGVLQYGSLASRLLRQSPVPVLITCSKGKWTGPGRPNEQASSTLPAPAA